MARYVHEFDAIVAAPFGRIGMMLRDSAVIDVSFLPSTCVLRPPRTPAARDACDVLRRYLACPHARLSLPLALQGTPFQMRVWRALQRIPAGRVLSYGELARRLGTSARAVGNACRSNPVPIFVPCHRVVAADGAGGFMGRRAGRALVIKRWLLAHERAG